MRNSHLVVFGYDAHGNPRASRFREADAAVAIKAAHTLGYQTLQDPNGIPIPIPYRILPQLVANGAQQNFHGFDWQFQGEFSNFRHPVQVNGQRLIAYPSLSYPLRATYGYIVPRLGYHFTRYKLNENSAGFEDETRGLSIASLDAGAGDLERDRAHR